MAYGDILFPDLEKGFPFAEYADEAGEDIKADMAASYGFPEVSTTSVVDVAFTAIGVVGADVSSIGFGSHSVTPVTGLSTLAPIFGFGCHFSGSPLGFKRKNGIRSIRSNQFC